MDKPYLLTYINLNDDGCFEYSWFDTEEEMDEFIKTNNIEIEEAIFIKEAEFLDKKQILQEKQTS